MNVLLRHFQRLICSLLLNKTYLIKTQSKCDIFHVDAMRYLSFYDKIKYSELLRAVFDKLKQSFFSVLTGIKGKHSR